MYNKEKNEIDFLLLLKTFWENKWILIIAISICGFAGYYYVNFVQKDKYHVSIPYAININPIEINRRCGSNTNCIMGRFNQRLIILLGNDWSCVRNKRGGDNSYILSHTTSKPLEAIKYEVLLKNINKEITSSVYNEAVSELTIIKKVMGPFSPFLNKLRITNNILYANRITSKFIEGQNVINYGKISILKLPHKKNTLIMLLFVLLGIFLGIFIVIVRYIIQIYKYRFSGKKV